MSSNTFSKTTTKPKYANARKNPYTGMAPFTVDEIITIIDDHETKVAEWQLKKDAWDAEYTKAKEVSDAKTSTKTAKAEADATLTKLKSSDPPRPYVLSYDTANENKSDALASKGIRYLQIMLRDLTGKVRPLTKGVLPTIISSTPKNGRDGGGAEDEKTGGTASVPNQWYFSTRILTDDESKLGAMVDERVNKLFPNLSDEEFNAEATRQEAIIKKEFLQWRVEKFISHEFETQLNDKIERTKIGFIIMPKSTMTIKGHVQYGRNPDPLKPEEMELAESSDTGLIPLENPMIYHKVKFDKVTYELWCKVYDLNSYVRPAATKGVSAAKSSPVIPAATMKDPATGRLVPVDGRSFGSWLTYESVITGSNNYQLCISSYGARLHAQMRTLYAKRAARVQGGGSIDDHTMEMMDAFGGNFCIDEESSSVPMGGGIDSQTTNTVTPGGSSAINTKLSDLDTQINNLVQ